MEEVNASPVGRHGILRAPVSRCELRHVELDRHPERHAPVGYGADRDATKATFQIDEEQFCSVPAPYRLITTVAGNYDAARRTCGSPPGSPTTTTRTERTDALASPAKAAVPSPDCRSGLVAPSNL
jgi:hypothetical protein